MRTLIDDLTGTVCDYEVIEATPEKPFKEVSVYLRGDFTSIEHACAKILVFEFLILKAKEKFYESLSRLS